MPPRYAAPGIPVETAHRSKWGRSLVEMVLTTETDARDEVAAARDGVLFLVPVTDSTIIYTHTDEAPALATYSFLPVVQAYAVDRRGPGGDPRHLPGRAHHRQLPRAPRRGPADRRRPGRAGRSWPRPPRPTSSSCRTSRPRCPQLKAAVAELQQHGYALPDYPDDPKTDEERDVRARYDKVMGSAVNPVLRQGNSDRRAPASVKSYAQGAPPPDGGVVAGLEDQRGPHGGRRLPLHRAVGGHRPRPARCGSSWSATTAAPRSCASRYRCWPARWSTPRSCGWRRCASSSPPRSPGPRPRGCCSRSTSRPP